MVLHDADTAEPAVKDLTDMVLHVADIAEPAVKDLTDMVLHDVIDDDDPDNPDSSPWKHWSFKMGMRMVMFKLPDELTYASRVGAWLQPNANGRNPLDRHWKVTTSKKRADWCSRVVGFCSNYSTAVKDIVKIIVSMCASGEVHKVNYGGSKQDVGNRRQQCGPLPLTYWTDGRTQQHVVAEDTARSHPASAM